MNNERLNYRTIEPTSTILAALKQMDSANVKSLIVLESNKYFLGILSIGDIQRAIINNIALEIQISSIIRSNPRVLNSDQSLITIKKFMLEYRMEFLPVIDNETKKILKVYFWEDIFIDKNILPAKQFNLPVVIMAGGTGVRLKPLTNVIPKPLIPIGEKTIIEHIFEHFSSHGCSSFYISVNYKADLIKYYLQEQKLDFNIHYFKETKPFGTAGSLYLLKDIIKETFFLSNCDIIIEQDYSEILNYHIANKNEMTIVAGLKHFPMAYGILESSQNGSLENLIEKPELTFKINSGLYILEPNLLNDIPINTHFDITQLINKIKERGGRIGVFPISEKSWVDIGNWNEYIKMITFQPSICND